MELVHKDPNVFHFSHPHPLEYCATPPSTGNTVTCIGCMLKVNHGEDYYKCKTCPFSLHHVCYNMPLITNHPSHPTHDLVLLVTPSTKTTLKCMACGHHVSGFRYHCAECNISFHSLCLALPVSIEITYHPHKMKLEFAPPYDFFCDLCNKPSYNGWLYRCNMCEFDTHIGCSVENLEPNLFQNPSFPQSSPLLSQLTSPQVEQHKRFGATVGDSHKGYEFEIMRLVAAQIGGGIRENFDCGWDKRLYSSPTKKQFESGKMKIELQEKEPKSHAGFSLKLEERTALRDKWTPPSDHSNTPSNNPYSESYFSIDLTKPYPYNSTTHERRSQLQREGGSEYHTTQDVKAERVVTKCGQSEESFGVANWQCNYSYDPAQHDKLNRAFFIKEGRASDFRKPGQIVMINIANENNAKWSVQDQTIAKSESEISNGSGWRNFLSCCL